MKDLVLKCITSGRTREYREKFWKLHRLKRQRRVWQMNQKRIVRESDLHWQALRKRKSHASNRAPPGEKQDDADQNERQAQAGPQAECAPATAETQPGPARKTTKPLRLAVTANGGQVRARA